MVLLLSKNELAERIEASYKLLESCRVCPRECGVNRLEDNKSGFCKSGLNPVISSVSPHHGEEPPLSGTRGSGTIFFTNCNLRCVYCQNYPISQMGNGAERTPGELACQMLYLQEQGCHNLNLVTPTHFMPQILRALGIARERGFTLPIVYNTSGYESLEALRLLDGIVDIYLPDMRYSDDTIALKYSIAPHYPEINRAAIKEMYRQVGNLVLDEMGIARQGLIIRHLILPDGISTQRIMVSRRGSFEGRVHQPYVPVLPGVQGHRDERIIAQDHLRGVRRGVSDHAEVWVGERVGAGDRIAMQKSKGKVQNAK
jgi:putative pyruvate formate lyase activating enzyme